MVTPPPINTEATTITTSLPEITPFIALQLRVARLEQEISEVKKTDHSADVLASIRSHVPTAVDNYLGTKLDDALLKVLERHTADLIKKYSVLPGPESVKNQESEKSPSHLLGRHYWSLLYQSTRKLQQSPHLSLKSLHSSPSAKKSQFLRLFDKYLGSKLDDALLKVPTKKRRSIQPILGLSSSSERMTKVQEKQGSLVHLLPKQHPALTSTRWQITDTRDAGADYSMHRSDPESEHSEQSSDDIPMKDEGNDSRYR
ncbi:hypothetical protein Tco_0895881 [Tanacetum coccineum]|uniref:Uncharacterized protein n=1 Tax=Tanacetum coccineum TaxID=301880 RepID=A0ABQ5CM28_9ASTR